MPKRLAAAALGWAAMTASCGVPQYSSGEAEQSRAVSACFGGRFASRVTQGIAGYADVVDIPGTSIGIVVGDALVYSAANGFADRSKKRPATPETLYNIASVTKVVTATLAMMLADEGDLDIDAAVAGYLPDSVQVPRDSRGDPITVRHLITHTSGLPKNPPNRRNQDPGGPLDPGIWDTYDVRDLYAALAATNLKGVAGEEFQYSNYGYALLGHALERVAGKPYERLLKERILDPLGMASTSITLSPKQQEELAAFYWSADPMRTERLVRAKYGEVAGFIGLTSNVPDLAKFLAAHLGSTRNALNAVPIEMAVAMRQPQIELAVDAQERAQVGLGWFRIEHLDATPHKTTLFHLGEVDGHTAGVYLVPADSIGVVVLQNLGGSDGQRAIDQIAFWLLERSAEELSRCRATARE
jgi:serine-type D-Ala-D-Ala carboxypeptidase/endopeptidase